jgi:hypothetical protein
VARGPGCPVAESLVEPDARLGGDPDRSGLRAVSVLAPVLGGRDRAVLLSEVAVERRLLLQVGGQLPRGHQPEEDRAEHGLQPQRVVHADGGQPAADLLDAGFGGTVGLAAPRAFGVDLDEAVGFELAQLAVDLRVPRGPDGAEQVLKAPGEIPAARRLLRQEADKRVPQRHDATSCSCRHVPIDMSAHPRHTGPYVHSNMSR